jgi:hypothetical protein
MPINAKDGTGATVFVSATGQGSQATPFIPWHVSVDPSGQYVPPLVASDLDGLATANDQINILNAITGTLNFNKSGLATSSQQASIEAAIEAVEAALLGPLDISGSAVELAGSLALEVTPLLTRGALFNASGDHTVIPAPDAGSRIVYTALRIQSESVDHTPCTVLVRHGSGDTNPLRLRCTRDGSGDSSAFSAGRDISLPPGAALIINCSAPVPIGVSVIYYIEAV